MQYTYCLYDLILSVPFPCPMLQSALEGAVPNVTIIEGQVPRSLLTPKLKDNNWQASPGRFLLLGGRRAGRFLVEDGKRITLERNTAAEDPLLCANLLTSVIAALLRQRGLLVLHANVVTTPIGAIAITGESGSGKSTTQAALLGQGCKMVSDDIAVLRLSSNGQILALPGVAKMNLCDDAAIKLGHDITSLPRNPLNHKVMVTVGHDATVTKPVPLIAIYQLCGPLKADLTVTTLAGSDKFLALQECIYGPQFAEEHNMFSISTSIAQKTPIFRIARSTSGWSVSNVAEAILRG